MSSRLVAVRFEVVGAPVTGRFWADLLGRELIEEPHGGLVPGGPLQVGLRFVDSTPRGQGRNRLHLHVTSATVEDQRRTVERVLELGGRRRGDGARPLPFGRDIYLTDPGGNEFCVIEPGNAYLADTGLLGEVTCEGTYGVGRFWLAALGWTLVWDQGQQIAIQSPAGGTKLAWDGSPEPDAPWWNRQRFDLAAVDVASEVGRLVGLGARVVGERGEALVLADPDGSEFSLVRATAD